MVIKLRRLLAGLYRVVVLAAYVVVSLVVFLEWLGLDAQLRVQHRAVNEQWRARVPDMIYGEAWKPFVLRTLLPSTVRVLRESVPEPAARRLERRVLRIKGLPDRLLQLGWEEEFVLEYLIASALMYGCLLGFVFALRDLDDALHEVREPERSLLPLAALLALPVFFESGTHFLYDFPTLFLFTLGLVGMKAGRWELFYVAFTLGALNRETTVLLTGIFVAGYARRLPRRLLVRHLLAQLGVFGVLRAVLAYAFRDNPGSVFEMRLARNLLALSENAGPTALVAGALLLLVALRFRREHRFLKAALAAVPPLVLSYLAFGVWGEIRVFYEAFPIVFLWTANALIAIVGRLRPRP